MPIETCWDLGLDAANSRQLNREGDLITRAIRSGKPASDAFAENGGFPKEFRQLYKMGERTGAIDENMERAAEMYSSIARKRLTLATLVYPQLLLLLIGVFVAIKVIGYYKGYFEDLLKIME